ncbi:MAG TPA: hypothetical protein VM577_05480 [Anaerovoracaceae bacterium]|nr:hypothetical protein [Anaerovoracaceae bacterium]
MQERPEKKFVPEGIEHTWYAGIKGAIDQVARLADDDMNRIIKIAGLNYVAMKGTSRMNVLKALDNLDKLNNAIVRTPAPADEFYKCLESQE